MNCACGKPLHYTDPAKQKRIEQLNKQFGDYIPVSVGFNGKKYMVQRHYIALHGIKGNELPELAAKLGFKIYEEPVKKNKK